MSELSTALIDKIREVLKRPELQPNAPRWDGTPTTHCNEAVDAIADEMGYDMKPVLEPKGIGYTGATTMCDNAAKAAEARAIFEVSGRQAQAWANIGVVVIALARRVVDDDKHMSHAGIVCPNFGTWNPAAGPWIGGAGAKKTHGFFSAYDTFTRWGLKPPHYYILPRKTA